MYPVDVFGVKEPLMASENSLLGSSPVKIRASGKWASLPLSHSAQLM